MYEFESTSPRTPSRWRAQGKVKALAGRDGLGFCPTFNQSAYLLFFPCVVALCAILPDSVSEPQEKNMIAPRLPCPGGETPGVQACQP